MMLNYLTGSEEVNHSLMSVLFSGFDNKMVKMLASGKSFILGVGDGNGAVGDWSVYPMNSILGQPFFFYTGTPSIIDNIVGFNSLSYNHGPFTAAAAAVPVNDIDVTGQIAYVSNIYDTFADPYYDAINRPYANDETSNYLSFFDYSLEAHNISGNYIAEKLGSTYFPGSDYHLPERHLNYGLADVFCENLGNLTWETEWNKYKCLRFHNFNSTGRLDLTFEETSQNFILDPFDCRSFRNNSGTWEQSPFRYFQDYRSGDPISYSYWPKSFAGKPWGKSSLFYHPKSRNSQSANNLLNPSILLNYVDLFGYRNGAITEDERALGDYPAGLNAFFHFMHEEEGLDITNLYCVNQPNYFSGSYSSGNFSHAITSSGYYQYQQPLLFPSGASNIDLIIKFPRNSQAVTVDMAPASNYGPGTVNCYAKYDEADDWIRLFSSTTTGWVAGQRKSLYLTNNRPFKQYKFKLNGFEESHLSFGFSGLELHGLFDDPRIDGSIIGNLFYHRGEVMKAKVSKTEVCFDGVTPQTTFERITFNGLDKLADWELEHQIGVTQQANGQYYLTNDDPDNYIDLIPISTNLFKVGGYDYSVVSGFMPLSLDNGITIDNHVFEYNAAPGDWGFSTYPGKATHLYKPYGQSYLNETKPPVIFATLSLTQNPATGGYIYDVWGDDFTWPAWQSSTGYLYGARVSRNKQRYQNLLDDTVQILNTGDPAGKAYNQSNDWRNVIYGEPYDVAYAGYLNHYYARSGQIFTYSGGDVNPANGISFYEASHTGDIEYKWDDFYANYHRDIWTISGTSVTSTWGTQYTGLINLNSDTVSLLKAPATYGFSGNGLNSIENNSLKFEPEGLVFSCDEVLSLPQGVEISFAEDFYGKFFGPFIGSGNSITRKRKNWFRGNGFGYMSDYLFGTANWVGPNAHSYFSSPRFPRPYSQINSEEVADFFNLVSGDLSRASGQDFEVKRNEGPTSISNIQVLHNFNPLISTETSTQSNEGNLYNQSTEHNFYYYKNDSRIENSLFDKNSFDLNSGEGFFYAAFRPDSYPLGTVASDVSFPENTLLGLNRRFYVPLMSEHYNLMAQSSNQCKYADPLALENFIYWTYSGASFQFREFKNGLTSLYALYNYDSPAASTNISYSSGPGSLLGTNHNKVLPSNYFIGFNQSGADDGAFFRQFFEELGVSIKTSADFPSLIADVSTGDIGYSITETIGVNLTFEGIAPQQVVTLNASGEYSFLDNVPAAKYTQTVQSGYTGLYYNYVDSQFGNFNWVAFDDWNNYLNTIGLNVPLSDSFIPLTFQNIDILTQNGRLDQVPTGGVNLAIKRLGSHAFGTYLYPDPFVTATGEGFEPPDEFYVTGLTVLGFDGYCGDSKLVYTQTWGSVSPIGIYIGTEATLGSGVYFFDNFSNGFDGILISGDSNSLWINPLDLSLISEAGTIKVLLSDGGAFQAVTQSASFRCRASGTAPVDNNLSYRSHLYCPTIDANGDFKSYFDFAGYDGFPPAFGGGGPLTATDLIKTKEDYTIDNYSIGNEFSTNFDRITSDPADGTLHYDDIQFNINLSSEYSQQDSNAVIVGNEFVCDDDFKKFNSQPITRLNSDYGSPYHHDYFRKIQYINSVGGAIIKYTPSGNLKDVYDPVLTEGNYLKKNPQGVSIATYPIGGSGQIVSSVTERLVSAPYIIEAPQTGVWRAEVLSFRTIDLS